jgi:hypothetical protein
MILLATLAGAIAGCGRRGGGQRPTEAGQPDGTLGSDGRPADRREVTPGDAPAPEPDAASSGGNDAGRASDGAPHDARPAPGSYSATIIHGGFTRLVIVKSDPARNLCFRLTLRSPDTDSALPLRLPDTWQVESAGATEGAGNCAAGALPPPAVSGATAGSGSVSWAGAIPCLVDVEVTLWFTMPSLPREEILRVRALVPSGC